MAADPQTQFSCPIRILLFSLYGLKVFSLKLIQKQSVRWVDKTVWTQVSEMKISPPSYLLCNWLPAPIISHIYIQFHLKISVFFLDSVGNIGSAVHSWRLHMTRWHHQCRWHAAFGKSRTRDSSSRPEGQERQNISHSSNAIEESGHIPTHGGPDDCSSPWPALTLAIPTWPIGNLLDSKSNAG